MAERQFTTPMIIEDDEAAPLARVPFDEKSYDESWLRNLLWRYPSLLPVGDIEPVFDGLLPVAKELLTASGRIDLVFVNADGMITIVETKLWRNAEARRKVVAQIIDYAKDLAKWSYSDFVAAARLATESTDGDPIIAAASESSDDFDEVLFMDRVSKNLRLGRFLLLIVGDGIREGVEEMVEFLQQAPSLGFTLALVEIGLFHKSTKDMGPMIVQPRILARTVEIERAVVTLKIPIDPTSIEVLTPAIVPGEEKVPSKRVRLTASAFYEQLTEAAGSEVVEFVKWALDEGVDLGLTIQWGDKGPMLKHTEEESGRTYCVAQFRKDGRLSHGKSGPPREIWYPYLDEVAKLVPGAARRLGDSPSAKKWGNQFVFTKDGKELPLSGLAERREEWLASLKRLIERAEERQD
jgi:hypothetical protein